MSWPRSRPASPTRIGRAGEHELMARASERVFCNNAAHADLANAALRYLKAIDDPRAGAGARTDALMDLQAAAASSIPTSSSTMRGRSAAHRVQLDAPLAGAHHGAVPSPTGSRPAPLSEYGTSFIQTGAGTPRYLNSKDDTASLGRVGVEPEMRYTPGGPPSHQAAAGDGPLPQGRRGRHRLARRGRVGQGGGSRQRIRRQGPAGLRRAAAWCRTPGRPTTASAPPSPSR